MEGSAFAFALFITLLSAGLGGFIARKLKQPLLLGYILAGVTIGWFAVQQIRGQESLLYLADIGIILLMFSLGLEFSFARLTKVKEIAVLGAVIQILATIVFSLLIFPRFGFDFYSSLFLGSCFALSSTAVVTKILAERGEIDSLPGEISVGWLLVQDLAVLPMILILPKLAVFQLKNWWQIFIPVAMATALILIVMFLSKKVVPKFLDIVAKLNSRELLLLAVVSLSLLAAFGTQSLGLSFALGAFLAGLIVSDSTQNHAIFAEIRPLKDVFSIIFFVTLGMMLSPIFFITHLGTILLISFIVMLIKLVIVLFLVNYLGYHPKTSWLVGINLVEIGEFSFILAQMGTGTHLISAETSSYILSVTLFTIVLSPFLINFAPKIYDFTKKLSMVKFPKIHAKIFAKHNKQATINELPFINHVVICGYGRVGSWLGRAFELSQIPYVVVDFDQQIISDLRQKGIPVIYGDPADVEVLDAAQVDKARILVIAIPDRHTQEMVIGHAQSLNRKIEIVCRSHFIEDWPRFKALGVQTIVQPEFEASLTMIHRILQDFGVSKDNVTNKIKRIKLEHGME